MRTNESAAGSTRLLHRLTAALLALVLAASAALPVLRPTPRRRIPFTSTVFRTCWPLPTNAALISGPKARP